MRVIFFHRKPRPGNFSIENVFSQVRNALPADVQWSKKELPFFSQGFVKRLLSSIAAAFYQKDVNHITGDIQFIALFLKKKRTVLTIHDVGLLNHPNRWARLLLKWFWIVLPVKKSAVITTVSVQTKEELLKYVDVNPSKIKVVYNPVSPLFIKEPKTFNKATPRILQIGTKHNKNVLRLIQSLNGIPCELDIIGNADDTLLQALDAANIKFQLSRNLSDEEIVEKYRTADIVSFISTHEGFGMPIIEANAIGRVVVTSNISSMPEIAGEAAHFVDPFDVTSMRNGILRVIEDDSYRETLITKGYANRKRFDSNEIALQYAEIYRSIEENCSK
jgi:glycosyltransferase involved in cell wall biosynthesis